MVKRCGKSAPREAQATRHGKPHRVQGQIGNRGAARSASVKAGRFRVSVAETNDSLRRKAQTEFGLQPFQNQFLFRFGLMIQNLRTADVSSGGKVFRLILHQTAGALKLPSRSTARSERRWEFNGQGCGLDWFPDKISVVQLLFVHGLQQPPARPARRRQKTSDGRDGNLPCGAKQRRFFRRHGPATASRHERRLGVLRCTAAASAALSARAAQVIMDFAADARLRADGWICRAISSAGKFFTGGGVIQRGEDMTAFRVLLRATS